jgi:opacity protein-like surface antigen
MFTPTNRVKYFIGGNIVTSLITGKLFVPPDFTNPNGPAKEVKINGAFRIGYSVFAGLEYAFEKNFGINFGFKFTHSNLFLKKTTEPTNDNETPLNDDSSELPVLYGGWKQFAFASAFAGFSYYFGVKEKRYKLP